MSAKSSISLVTFWISIELPRRSQKSILDCCFDWRHPLNARGTHSTKFKSCLKRLVLKWITMHDISVRVVFAGISIKKVWRRCFRFSVNANEYNFGNFPAQWEVSILIGLSSCFPWFWLVNFGITRCRILLYEEMSRCIALHCIASHCSFLRYLVCLVFPRQTNSSDDQSWSDKFQLVLQVARKVQVIVGSIKRKIKSLRCSERFHFVILWSSC